MSEEAARRTAEAIAEDVKARPKERKHEKKAQALAAEDADYPEPCWHSSFSSVVCRVNKKGEEGTHSGM